MLPGLQRRLTDDWAYAYDETVYAPPVIPLMDVGRALVELERVMAMGARAVCLRAGPCTGGARPTPTSIPSGPA